MTWDKLKQLLLKISVSVGLFVVLLSNVDEKQMLDKLRVADFRYAAVVLVLLILNYVISSMRWKKLLIFENSARAGLGYLTTLYFTGSFFNNFMPTSIGGDVYKIIKLGKKIDSKTNSFTATFMERFLGVLVLVLISLVSFVQTFGWISLVILVAIGISGLIGIKALKFLSKKFTIVKNVIDSIRRYKKEKDVLFYAFLLSVAVQLVALMGQYFVFSSLGYFPPVAYSLFVLPVITLAGFFIPSLNGIGVQDALYVSMFAVVGVPAETALTASILYHILRLVVSLIGGILYALGLD